MGWKRASITFLSPICHNGPTSSVRSRGPWSSLAKLRSASQYPSARSFCSSGNSGVIPWQRAYRAIAILCGSTVLTATAVVAMTSGAASRLCSSNSSNSSSSSSSRSSSSRDSRSEEGSSLPRPSCWELLASVPRAITIYSTVFSVWWDYRRTRGRAEQKREALGLPGKTPAGEQDPAEVEAIWEAVHQRNAPKIRRIADKLGGLWVKVCQYLSSRPDVVPMVYIQTLAGLQDSAKASPWNDIASTLIEAFGPDWANGLDMETTPLATASVAQVYRGRLREDNSAVAVKVQKKGVDFEMRLDLVNFAVLLDLLHRFEPDQDWRPVVSEWSAAVSLELDFVREAQNLREVASSMERAGVRVIVPMPKEGWVARRVLVMDFCEGRPVRDKAELEGLGVDCRLLLDRVCRAFAVQIHEDGFFNADPHPGNVHVSTDTRQNGGDPSVPILLDYGLTKRFEPHMRLAFARLMFAADAADVDQLQRSLEDMGFIFERDPLEDLANMRRLFTAVPMSQAAEQRRERAEEVEKAKEKEEKKKAEDIEAAKAKATRRKVIEAWPTELIFFLRVTGLLKGLAASLDIPVDYMGLMAVAARNSLRDAVPEAQRARSVLCPADPLLLLANSQSKLQKRLEQKLEELHAAGDLRGMQVCVAGQGGVLLASACAGELGAADPRPVQPNTLFCVFSAGKAPCAAAVLRLVEEGKLSLHDSVATHWPEFGAEGKHSCTVEHVLRHRAGLANAWPTETSFDQLLRIEAMEDVMAQAKPETAPGEQFAYHYLSFGWILAGLVRRAAGADLAEVVRSRVTSRLGLADEMMLGVPEDLLAAEGRLASLEVKMPKNMGAGQQASPQGRVPQGVEGSALLSPTVFNMRKVRAACIPAANLHCSGRALARFYAGLGKVSASCGDSELLGSAMLQDLQKPLQGKEGVHLQVSGMDSNPAAKYGLGMKVFEFSRVNGGKPLTGVGHAGVGGSIGLVIPELGIGMAVTVNQLEMNGQASKAVLAVIFEASELESLRSQLSEAQAQLSELDLAIAARSERVRLNEREYVEVRVEYDALASANQALSQELATTRSRIAQEQQGCRAAEQELHELQTQLRAGEAEFGADVESIQNRRRALEATLRETSAAMAASDKEAADVRAQTLGLQAQLEVLNAARDELQVQQFQASNKQHAEVSQMEARAEELAAEASELAERHAQVKSQLQALHKQREAPVMKTPQQMDEDAPDFSAAEAQSAARALAAERCGRARNEVAEAEQRLAALLRQLGDERRQSLELARELTAAREAAAEGFLAPPQ
ncbi:unnamed protein product, partial [Polarella glacialis]